MSGFVSVGKFYFWLDVCIPQQSQSAHCLQGPGEVQVYFWCIIQSKVDYLQLVRFCLTVVGHSYVIVFVVCKLFSVIEVAGGEIT